MSKPPVVQCPYCSDQVLLGERKVGEGRQCRECDARFEIIEDADGAPLVLRELNPVEVPDPLGLPKGSIRAIATILAAGTSWFLVLTRQDVPGYLYGLLLTIIGYYFGMRSKKSPNDHVFPAQHVNSPGPLYLPRHVIRVVLVLGFAAAAVTLHLQQKLLTPSNLEFFTVLAGLILGYLLARGLSHGRPGPLVRGFSNLLAVVVLLATMVLTVLLVSGAATANAQVAMLLASAISFYYGARS